MDVTVRGKRVTFRDSVTVKEGHLLPRYINQSASGDLLDQIPALMLVIESWEFEGAPSATESYERLSLAEFDALGTAAADVILRVIGKKADLKN